MPEIKVSRGNGTRAADWSIMSYLGRVAYNYDSKYLFTANFPFRRFFQAFSGQNVGAISPLSRLHGVSLRKEFMKDITWIDDLKLRGGWGQTGNQSGISDYAYLQDTTTPVRTGGKQERKTPW